MFKNIFNNYVISYLNNTFIYSNKTFKDHKQKINFFLNCFKKYEFYFKFEKYTFH